MSVTKGSLSLSWHHHHHDHQHHVAKTGMSCSVSVRMVRPMMVMTTTTTTTTMIIIIFCIVTLCPPLSYQQQQQQMLAALAWTLPMPTINTKIIRSRSTKLFMKSMEPTTTVRLVGIDDDDDVALCHRHRHRYHQLHRSFRSSLMAKSFENGDEMNVADDPPKSSSLSSSSSTTTSHDDDDSVVNDFTGKTVYQRVFYRFSSGSQINHQRSMVVEERVRFQAAPDDTRMLVPIGPTTIILRDGAVEDGEIGSEFFVMNVLTSSTAAAATASSAAAAPTSLLSSSGMDPKRSSATTTTGVITHKGAGWSLEMESTLATAMYCAANPTLFQNKVLQLACDSGLAGILGAVGAAYALEKKEEEKEDEGLNTNTNNNNNNENDHDDNVKVDDDDILTIPSSSSASNSGVARKKKKKETNDCLPLDLELLILSDANEESLKLVQENLRNHPKLSSNSNRRKIALQRLDWSVRTPPSSSSRTTMMMAGRRSGTASENASEEYQAILASDVAFSYPQAKDLARIVAHTLAPSYLAWISASSSSLPSGAKRAVPQFVHVCPDARDDVPYLHRLLEKGYRMRVVTGYLKMEKLMFGLQVVDTTLVRSNGSGGGGGDDATDDEMMDLTRENALLDELDLELHQFKETVYQSLTAEHHPDYAGGGSGELFFPMETGEYDASSSSSFSTQPWGQR